MRGGGWKTEVGGRRGWRWAQHGSDQYYLHTKFPREWNKDGKGRDRRGEDKIFRRGSPRFIYPLRDFQVRQDILGREPSRANSRFLENPFPFERDAKINVPSRTMSFRFKSPSLQVLLFLKKGKMKQLFCCFHLRNEIT